MLDVPVTTDLTKSREYHQLAERYCPGGTPDGKWWTPNLIYFVKAQGARLIDLDGNEYLDYHCGAGPVVLGHANPDVNAAVIDCIQNVGTQFGLPHQREIELARRLRACIPGAEMAVFCNAGTDAVQFAVRLARAVTGREKIVKFEGGYHGWADSVAISTFPRGDLGPADAPSNVPDTAGALRDTTRQTIVLPYNNIDVLRTRLRQERHQVAAVLIEPYIHGCNIRPRQGFLQDVRAACEESGVLLILDEIVTGFRHDLGGLQRVEGIVPDLSLFGKAMANGYPISAVVGKSSYMSAARPTGDALLTGTFNGNPVSVTAALKTIELLQRPGFYPRLFALGDALRSGVEDAIKRANVRARCVGYGSVWYLHFDSVLSADWRDVLRYLDDDGGAAKERAYRNYLLNHGIFIFPARGTRAYISAAHTDADIQHTVDVVTKFFTTHAAALR